MFSRLLIIGAGGHGRVIADIAVRCGYTDIAFLDDNAVGNCMGFPIVGTGKDIKKWNDGCNEFIIAIGNNAIRERIAGEHNVKWATLIHPSAQIGMGTVIQEGTVVMAGAVVNPCATVGRHCIINTCAVVEHDNVLEDFVHISPNAALGGVVTVGKGTHIGIGASVKHWVHICEYCAIGAGAVVVKDIGMPGTYMGIPAKRK